MRFVVWAAASVPIRLMPSVVLDSDKERVCLWKLVWLFKPGPAIPSGRVRERAAEAAMRDESAAAVAFTRASNYMLM